MLLYSRVFQVTCWVRHPFGWRCETVRQRCSRALSSPGKRLAARDVISPAARIRPRRPAELERDAPFGACTRRSAGNRGSRRPVEQRLRARGLRDLGGEAGAQRRIRDLQARGSVPSAAMALDQDVRPARGAPEHPRCLPAWSRPAACCGTAEGSRSARRRALLRRDCAGSVAIAAAIRVAIIVKQRRLARVLRDGGGEGGAQGAAAAGLAGVRSQAPRLIRSTLTVAMFGASAARLLAS